MGIGKIGKVNSFFMCLVVMAIILCCSNQVQAAQKTQSLQEGDFTYTVTDEQAQIMDYSGTGEKIIIPSILGGVPVTSIGDQAFSDCSDVNSITIPKGVTSIGEGAFSGCKSLISISLPESITSIGDCAFEDCTGLTSISIPPKAALIGEDTFKGCTNLTSITRNSATSTVYKQAYRKIATKDNGYGKITATITLPSRDKAEDLDITSGNSAASYNYFGCQRKDNGNSDFDFEFGFGFKPCENKMMQFGIYYSLKAGSGEDQIKDWNWLKPETGSNKFYAFDYGTTHQIQLAAYDGKIKVSAYDEDNNLEYSGSWSFPGPAENGDHQKVRRVTSLLVPAGESATAKNYCWTTTNVGAGSTLKEANASNCNATTSFSGDEDWIEVVSDAEYYEETINFDID